MGRMVTVPLVDVAITGTANQDIFSLMASATNKLILHGWEITSSTVAATNLSIKLHRITAAGTVGSALTPVKDDQDDGAITGSARANDTAPGAAGDIFAGYQWEQMGPLGHVYTPEMRKPIELSTGIALVLITALAFTASGWITWEEI